MALAMLALNLPRSGLVQHQDTEDGSESWFLCWDLGPLLIFSVRRVYRTPWRALVLEAT
jgi:hypothetical protein